MLNRGRHNAQCLPVWKQSGPTLSAGCAHVGCAILGLSWAYLGPSPAHVEPSPWAYVRPSWAHVELCWAHVGPMLGLCWPMLAYVGPMLAHVEPSWKLCWGHVWPSYVETILRCQFLRPGPPPGAQNQVKTQVFQHRQDEIPCRRRARNTVKKKFFNTASTIHRKWQGLRGGSGLEAGRRQGRQRLKPSVTTEGLRQRHGLPVGRRPDLKAYAWQPGAGRATTFGLWCGKIVPRFSAQTQGGLCWTEAGIMRSACLYGSSLGLSWAQLVFWAAKTQDPPAWNTMATKDGEATKSHPKNARRVFWNPRELALQLTPSEPPKHWTRQPETPWQWRTKKPPNRTKKLPNVSSEILEN